MDMSGLMAGGMDMTGASMFQPQNIFISHLFWYLITAVVTVGLIANIWQRVDSRLRKRAAIAGTSMRHPSVPTNAVTQAYATVRTIFRELSYPQGLYITRPGFQWLSPPTVGQGLTILAYWITITVMLTTNSISPKSDPYYFERIGFRAAWVSVMQIPLIVLIGGKVNIVGILIGSSYERLNWLHRWISRTIIVTIACHAGFFLREWIRADFLATELAMMPMVKYGMACGGLILWMNISGLAPIRRRFYEFFVLQHLASIGALLYCLHTHVPSYAMFYIWMAIGFIAFDRGVRSIWVVYRNIRIRSKTSLALADRIGYRTEIHALPGETTNVVIKNVPFTWSPGQHVYIWIPSMGFIETHPFTISNIATENSDGLTQSAGYQSSNGEHHANLQIRAHGGFSRRLHNLAKRHATDSKPYEVRSFIQGPFGTHPTWNTFETLVLISASTGGSFTLPIMESILADPCCVRKCHFVLLVRESPQCSCYLHRLRAIARASKHPNLTVSVHVAVTGENNEGEAFEGDLAGRCCCGNDVTGSGCVCGSDKTAKRISIASSSDEDSTAEQIGPVASCCAPVVEEEQTESCCAPAKETATTTVVNEKTGLEPTITATSKPLSMSSTDTKMPTISLYGTATRDVNFVARRPLLSHTIREAVEAASGETCVVVCGGKELSGDVRNEVVKLSDERAVHKGTGAQGIALWVEEFGF
ncbi:hypothetical protein BT63DRAFT_414621 [Microthyrium microscopicum]|uniref:ferric-chelate reductase (NADPH) n=1 Tax=Microthyrium microscopicum TaxID=703497 RepID=A0A6A6UCI9_9PEZI|nr:hypothetical protein BT63DRAFT_414621 [Microthyrium microscopicum]